MISVSLEKPLFIQLDIPSSPLLLSLPLDAGSLLNPPPPPPCTTLPLNTIPFPKVVPSVSSSSSSSLMHHSLHSVPEIMVTRPLSELAHDESTQFLPSRRVPPRTKPRLSTAASKKLVEFVDFLDRIDRDMTAEVEHVKESIREAREYAGEWREERRARKVELLRKKEREKKETKQLDSDFWLGV
ncbi:hypothetical protein BJV78DRAFT_445715 [Lactifluus subvellereus]|nr:hypothetical protein BJV78DRAFT_445715 [Lactifluus subvellereus]